MTEKAAPHVVVHTDGGCAPSNPGPGGWAAILRSGEHIKELKGGEATSTNNRMELMAAIAALEALKRPSIVDMNIDSQYVRDGITKYINNWKRNGWRTAAKAPVKNRDLWERLDAARNVHTVRWHWVKGHAGDPFNERADALVHEARAELRQGADPGRVAGQEPARRRDTTS
jgi:ribonuclease HI